MSNCVHGGYNSTFLCHMIADIFLNKNSYSAKIRKMTF